MDFDYESHNPELDLQEENLGITPEDITRKSHNGMAIRKSYETVKSKADSEIYDPAELAEFEIQEGDLKLQLGGFKQLHIKTTPEIANTPELVWESSDLGVITLNQEGRIYAEGVGTAEVSASKPGSNLSDKISVEVVAEIIPGPIRPKPRPNTPEEQATEEAIETALANGETSITVDTPINNVTIPETVTKLITINGPIQDGATIINNSTKGISIANTSDEVASITIQSGGTVYMPSGKYETVYLAAKSISGSSGKYATISNVVFGNEVEGTGNLSVIAAWTENASVVSYNTNNLNIGNGSNDETVLENMTIVAPYATVSLSATWGDVEATVGEDTLNLKESFKAKKLFIRKGNVVLYNSEGYESVADEIVNKGGGKLSIYTVDLTATNKKVGSNAGIYNVTEDLEGSQFIGFGISQNGNFKLNLDHNITSTGSKTGPFFQRGTATVNYYGTGTIDSDNYGLWVSAEKSTANIYGGHFIADTHAVYAENGTINIYGGEFEVKGEDKRYVINCYDSSYTSGKAKINVYGGIFHDFDPANSISEPGGPVSFVAPGYKSVETEPGIFVVVKDE